ncbi:hypothetical protein E2C01_028977 [Portunus trituberculatus]|uniref:Uncharacterized protein n=1 Tax=Portunus trituberculatus TaxID=210409 RepID=A0A5B7EMY9_PORTR|nr:hypothetical protein [Portunus trituberculatus]
MVAEKSMQLRRRIVEELAWVFCETNDRCFSIVSCPVQVPPLCSRGAQHEAHALCRSGDLEASSSLLQPPTQHRHTSAALCTTHTAVNAGDVLLMSRTVSLIRLSCLDTPFFPFQPVFYGSNISPLSLFLDCQRLRRRSRAEVPLLITATSPSERRLQGQVESAERKLPVRC